MTQGPRQERYVRLFGEADPRLVQDFADYHKANPALFELFRQFSDEALNQGRGRFSIWMIANRIRWYCQVETTGQTFKVSNDFLALYARLLIFKDPKFEGFFKLKKMKKHRVKAVT